MENALNNFEEKLTTIFLTDSVPAKKILLLKRASSRNFAPGMYTGTGGKIEDNENQAQGAKRELKEETGLDLPIVEFGRVIVNKNKKILCQFHGIYNSENVPGCTEGLLEWVAIESLPNIPIISTARVFLEECVRRGFDPQKPFTLFVERDDASDINSKINITKIAEGLCFALP